MKEKKASHGDKMIEIHVKFWTNNIAKKKDHLIPKLAWDAGMVVMESNKTHGIKGRNPRPFHSLNSLPAIIEKVLVETGVKLKHGSKSMKLYK